MQSAARLTSAVIAAKLPDRGLRVLQVVPGYLAAAGGSAELRTGERRHMISTPKGTYFTLPQVLPAADAQEARLWAPAQVDDDLNQNTY